MLELDKIYNMDCIEGMKQIDDNSIDLIVTDPPFVPTVRGSTVLNSKFYNKDDLSNFLILEGWWETILRECKRILRNKKLMYTFCDWRTYPSFWRSALRLKFNTINTVVWIHNSARRYSKYRYCYNLIFIYSKGTVKRICPTGTKDGFDVWECKNISSKKRLLPSQKPLELFKKIILDASNKNDVILDPYIGSGTTALVCKQLNRHFIGFEIDKDYYNVGLQRLLNQPEKLEEWI